MSDKVNIQEYRLKFRRKLSLTEPLKVDSCYRVGIDIEIGTASKISHQDGSYSIEFIGDVVGGELIKDNGVIPLRKKSTQSQELRFQIEKIGEDYDKVMNAIRGNLGEIIQDYLYQR